MGGKHSGKTTIIEQLIFELRSRGYRVGTIKEMIRISTLDTPGKETDRYAKAGAEIIVALPRNETVVFIKKRLNLKTVIPFLKNIDFVLLEGFEEDEIKLPKIVAAKTCNEVKYYLDGWAIAISGLIVESEEEAHKLWNLKIPLLSSKSQSKEMAELTIQKALEM